MHSVMQEEIPRKRVKKSQLLDYDGCHQASCIMKIKIGAIMAECATSV